MADISKTAGHKVTKFKYFCQGQNLCLKFLFSPLGQRVLPGAKKVQKKMTGMIWRTVSQFDAKFYLKVPWRSALNLFQANLLISIKWGSRRAPQNWILTKKPIFLIFNIFYFFKFIINRYFFWSCYFFFTLTPIFKSFRSI